MNQNFIITTTSTVQLKDAEITAYLGVVSGETVIGANIVRDFFAGIRDIVGGRSGSYEQVLKEAKDTAILEMKEQAVRMGANGIVGVDLDYETIGQSMLMVTASGTAVKIS